jgi:hypothetical protein
MQLIRKISIGPDYKTSMHYVVGQEVLDKSYSIDTIRQLDNGSIQIFISKDREVMLWKAFNETVPKVIEFNINF